MNNLTIKRYIYKILKLNNYKKDYRLNIKLPMYLHYTLIGLLLSDGGLQRFSETSNVRLSVIMSIKSYPYIFHLYNLFEPYIDTELNVLNINSSNNIVPSPPLEDEEEVRNFYSTVIFKTISMPQLLYYYNIFYKKDIISNK